MRYLPLTDADRKAMLAKIGVADIDALFADVPKDKRLKGLLDLPKAKGELEVERVLGGLAAREYRGRIGPLLRRRRGLQAPYSGHGRSSDPALRVPHLLHALPAGDRAGHAAVPVRVPDAGRHADGHGGGERLHVRRLDGGGRGGADGASRDQAAPRGAGRQPASALSRDHRDGVAAFRARGRGSAGGAGRARRIWRRRSTTRCPASSCRRRTSTAICTI